MASGPPPASDVTAATVRVRLDLAYDGTGFAGWARQPGRRTVQGVLEDALGTVLRLPGPARLTVAGRTDAGVHARGQVAHLDIPQAAWQALPGRSDRAPDEALVRRLAGVLGRGTVPRGSSEVVVRAATEAPPGFDARFAATWRRYAYRIADQDGARDPVRRHDVLWHGRPLDVDAMAAAADLVLGEHDFAAFCKPRPGATTIRTLLDLTWQRVPSDRPDGGLVVATVRADAFCHSMVRALVGAALAVGEGRRPPHWPAEVLAGRARVPGVAVAPAHGLTLEAVGYPPADQLSARAAQARSVRVLGAERPTS
ncbi:tRNA pseudouridine(38-40) synthase TruA [Georgenia sp. TF02-10]|uniref:tRNA pseudouridine(38-40) synthase TruA n=1 Tax=Georgenia sp. TF02-10 TaxID=2917725 RepID=UPI001FA76AB6|nr:tRNA pseudouridine(38-40) synthase TruA [Georgenia sp. TF02-10]UNX56466.1 tRNA pseudouridine(38-40) synthase TruA [Georgenia sp. TF02-10]